MNTSSGDVELEKELEVAVLTLQTVSGDLECPQLKCGVADIHSTSGDVEVSGLVCDLKIHTVSGDCDFRGAVERVTAKSTSGDVTLKLENVPGELNVTTVSGDTKLYLPDNDGFYLHYKRVSGDVRSDFNLKTSLSDKSGTAVYLTGADRHYTMQTVSGDLRLYRR